MYCARQQESNPTIKPRSNCSVDVLFSIQLELCKLLCLTCQKWFKFNVSIFGFLNHHLTFQNTEQKIIHSFSYFLWNQILKSLNFVVIRLHTKSVLGVHNRLNRELIRLDVDEYSKSEINLKMRKVFLVSRQVAQRTMCYADFRGTARRLKRRLIFCFSCVKAFQPG